MCTFMILYFSCVDDCMEMKVLEDYYSQLTSILPIDRIAPELVSARIITIQDLEEIDALKTSKDKASFVLQRIAKSLNGGVKTSFYKLLEIMEDYGGDIAALAKDIKTASSGDLSLGKLVPNSRD